MKDMVLLGDEAFALGTLHAGLSAGFGYPGTPSTEIMEYLIDNYERNRANDANTPVAQWCSNEKTALEAALGVSFAGRRAVVDEPAGEALHGDKAHIVLPRHTHHTQVVLGGQVAEGILDGLIES